jgi:hypothetical protein
MDSESNFAQWVVLGNTKAKLFTENTLTDITRAAGDYTGQTSDRWSGCVLNGIAVLNNSVDAPQAWLTPTPVTKLTALANWPASTTAACMRSFKQYLVALDVTKGATRYPTMVKWSHPADPGTVPSSWDHTDPTKDAGEVPLSETLGACVDCVPLKDVNIIYKTDSVWGMQYIGGAYVFRFYKIFGDWGMPVRDCAIEFLSGQHLVFTGSDIIIHDGNTVRSVVSGRMRDIIRRINAAQLQTCYMVLNAENEEVWFCFRRATDNVLAADTALVYNWIEETVSLRELDDYRCIMAGRLDSPPQTGTTWATAVGSWLERLGIWGAGSILPASRKLFGAGTLKLMGVDYSTETSPMYVERVGLGVPFKSDKAPDMSSVKFMQRVWPRITGNPGDVVGITLGASMGPGQPTVWEPKRTYIIGTSTKIDCTLTGRTFGIRVESEETLNWRFTGFDADVRMTGNN